ncbi:DUF3102 domain-containing protein [Xenorhabdus ehlersii]|uniref:DUF3102 domain-containing protein n=1 Tax=Xenorhabdus ehlersii TaxID=290111 RepID=A0A2D0IRU6_9GAMM|nr:DUF3102 domain-containing protein [Xenorhabdus ehlersii]PHM24607.1 hypothetical protein Xehl_01857 [Xenorhabdus ehlersii]RKE91246.1 hypothetical protein BDE27_1455 [Xenorhabdus ehlersii]
MARTKNTTSVGLAEEIQLADDLQVNLNAMTTHRLQIMEQFGDGLPYDCNRIVHEAKFYMAQSAEAMLEAGKRLIILKENEPHGEFVDIVRDQLGLEPRIAQKMAQAALKFLSPGLEAKAKTFSLLGRSKLYELMLEDDEELSELAEGGTVAGLTLDDIDRMSVRELRKALRDTRNDLEISRQAVQEKKELVSNLIEEKSEIQHKLQRRIHHEKPEEESEALTLEVNSLAFAVDAAIINLFNGFTELNSHTMRTDISHIGFMTGLLDDIEIKFRDLRNQFNLPEYREHDVIPDWAKEGAEEQEKEFKRPDWMEKDEAHD